MDRGPHVSPTFLHHDRAATTSCVLTLCVKMLFRKHVSRFATLRYQKSIKSFSKLALHENRVKDPGIFFILQNIKNAATASSKCSKNGNPP